MDETSMLNSINEISKLPCAGQHTYLYCRSLLTAAADQAHADTVKRLLQEIEIAASAQCVSPLSGSILIIILQ